MSLEGKGESLVAEAEGLLRKGGGIMGMFGGSKDRFEDAAAIFNRAGMSFKAVKKWGEAAKAYKRAGECFVKSKSESEAAAAYTECARSYVKAGDGKSALRPGSRAITRAHMACAHVCMHACARARACTPISGASAPLFVFLLSCFSPPPFASFSSSSGD